VPLISLATGMRTRLGSTSSGPNRNVGEICANAAAIHSRLIPISFRGSNPVVACTTHCGSTISVSK